MREISSFINTENYDFGGVVFGDLNRFKGVNDSFGHQAGDLAISLIGEKIKEIFVDDCEARAFRQSGDEFVILIPTENINHFKESVKNFTEISFVFEKQIIKTAMSFGLALIDEKTDFDTLLQRAETACQQAKIRGDGQIIEWTEDIERSALINLRERCNKCGTKMSCNIPKDQNPKKLTVCAFCGEPLK